MKNKTYPSILVIYIWSYFSTNNFFLNVIYFYFGLHLVFIVVRAFL